MITKVEKSQFFQKCVCGQLFAHDYTSFSIVNKVVKLPPCTKCKSLEVLYNNNADDEHSLKVTKVFAKIATQG